MGFRPPDCPLPNLPKGYSWNCTQFVADGFHEYFLNVGTSEGQAPHSESSYCIAQIRRFATGKWAVHEVWGNTEYGGDQELGRLPRLTTEEVITKINILLAKSRLLNKRNDQ